MISTLLKNGMIVENNKLVQKHIFISDGKIRDISDEKTSADNVIDLDGKVVLPGLIDAHVHFREPGLTQKGDFLSESRAAARGGITTIIDMPNTVPPTTTVSALEEKRLLAKKSVVNYGFHFGATEGNSDEIRKARNIASLKVFMDSTTGDLRITENLEEVFSSYPLISVHAENEKVKEAVDLIRKTRSKLYLCHISSDSELKPVTRTVKSKAYVEVTPHHLFLTESSSGPMLKVKPSLKSQADQDALWEAINKGIVDTICTDHAPHTIEDKKSGAYGLPGVETMLPLLLDAVNRNRLSLHKIIELCCHNPAKIFKIRNKGFLEPGYDADLVIIDLSLEKQVRNEEMLTKVGWSPFDGKILKGWPVMTFVNGNLAFGNKDIKAKEIAYESYRKVPKRQQDVAGGTGEDERNSQDTAGA